MPSKQYFQILFVITKKTIVVLCNHEVCYPKQGDFLVDHKYLFEVGGKNKTFEQIKDVQDSFLAVDGIEIGSRSRIPLWMFGLLY